MAQRSIKVNRAPVLTLWAAVVAERIGYEPDEALTLGKAVSGLNAQTKGKSLGIFHEHKEKQEIRHKQVKEHLERGELFLVDIVGRSVLAKATEGGVRAVAKDSPIDPQSVKRYLERKFGPELEEARASMARLAKAYSPDELRNNAYSLYEKFRPIIPGGKGGWGAQGELDLDYIDSLAG